MLNSHHQASLPSEVEGHTICQAVSLNLGFPLVEVSFVNSPRYCVVEFLLYVSAQWLENALSSESGHGIVCKSSIERVVRR